MRRRIGNLLIALAYLICPSLKHELQHAVEQLAYLAADVAAHDALLAGADLGVQQVLAHQERVAAQAMRQ